MDEAIKKMVSEKAATAQRSALSKARRSALYMPGSNARALEKARSLPADILIFDLEDAVAPDAKALARSQVCQALETVADGADGHAAGETAPEATTPDYAQPIGRPSTPKPYGRREVLIRVNALDTPWGVEDLNAVARSGADGVVLPKVNRPEDVLSAEAVLSAAGAPDDLALWAMIETPRGVLEAGRIADSSPRMAGLIMGTSDLAKDLRAAHTPDREPFLTALGLCLLAARAAGLAALDGVHLDLNDAEGFERSCRQGAAMGFDGKTLIHPRTIEAANRIFAPSPEAVAAARRVTEAYAEAQAAGKGVVVVDGRLVEALHVEEAQRTLALAEDIARRDNPGT